jgi:hypothetical protein
MRMRREKWDSRVSFFHIVFTFLFAVLAAVAMCKCDIYIAGTLMLLFLAALVTLANRVYKGVKKDTYGERDVLMVLGGPIAIFIAISGVLLLAVPERKQHTPEYAESSYWAVTHICRFVVREYVKALYTAAKEAAK